MQINKKLCLGHFQPVGFAKLYLTKKEIINAKLNLLSEHSDKQGLAIYRDLNLSDVAEEYESDIEKFSVK